MKINQPELDSNSPTKTNNQFRTHRLILLILSLLIPILIGYFIWHQTQLNAAQKSVYDCSINNNCDQIISALETLVKAQKSLKVLNLNYTNLEDANLEDANLYRTNLYNTNLEDTNLFKANLYRTNLSNANFKNANLKSANLSSAILIYTKNLTPTQIKLACNWEDAFYKGQLDDDYSKWIIDKQANQQFIRQLQQDKDSDPKQPVDCSLWKHWSQDKRRDW